MLKKLTFILLVCATALTITSCSTSPVQYSTVMDNEAMTQTAQPQTPEGSPNLNAEMTADKSGTTAGAIAANISNRKVITSASFNVQTKDYDWTSTALEAKIAETKSYVENSYTSGDKAKGNATLAMTIRVPTDLYSDFKTSIPELGNVVSSSENGDDVTADYFDTEARLTVLLAQEKRILVLLEKANIEEIIKIEERLSQIRTEIEQLTTVVKRYDDLVSYATVTLNIQQTSDYIDTSVNETFFSKMGKAFGGSLKQAGEVVQNGVLAIIWMMPYLILLAIITALCLYSYKKRKKRMQNAIIPPVEPTFPPSEKNSDETTHTF